ncbi:hypothetical protein [Cupriavidus campinensis]|uniref:hypothetical protein n=1 Tax=Cupriavidus campinensis TaxID=151783 RepID=UPI0016568406|nr:hypothetical protein [Cupriavidus campinensis]
MGTEDQYLSISTARAFGTGNALSDSHTAMHDLRDLPDLPDNPAAAPRPPIQSTVM